MRFSYKAVYLRESVKLGTMDADTVDGSHDSAAHSPNEEVMIFRRMAIALIVAAPFASVALAQGVGTEVQRDINQESRIEQGLKSGQLSTGEASKLERGVARIDRMEKNALKDGTLSQQEANRIPRAKCRVWQDRRA